MSDGPSARAHPARWVPSLYFAEGLPFFAVNLMALLFYQGMGISNTRTTLVVSLLAWPWTLKPVWSPLLEMYKTKKFFVVVTELLGGLCLLLLAAALALPSFFVYSVAALTLVAFLSSTHDIAADGLYIASLSRKEQAEYTGWQGASYNVARVFSQSGLLILVGALIAGSLGVPAVTSDNSFLRLLGKVAAAVVSDVLAPLLSVLLKVASVLEGWGIGTPEIRAWMVVFSLLGVILMILSLYHAQVLPRGGEERHQESFKEMAATFKDVLLTFLRKRNILLLLVFILLYRAGEGQVVKIGPLFLKADRATGGLGLTLQQFGTIYGLFGAVSFVVGSIAGGYFTSFVGLKRALLPLLCVLNFPMVAYWYLSTYLPTNSVVITTAMSLEMFGYGFGFVGVILLMMQEIAPGKYQTAHYAFANSLMNLGLIVPGALSGFIQTKLGYQRFFVWVLLSSIPALFLSRFVPIRGGAEAAEEAEAGAA